MTGRHVMFGCNSPRAANSGMAGTLLAEGAALERLGWTVSYVFAPGHTALPTRAARQFSYLRMARAVRRARPDVAVISSGDGLLVPFTARATQLVVQSHGLEHLHRCVCVAAGVDRDHFGWGHRFLREPAVAYAMRRAAAVVVKNRREAAVVSTVLGIQDSRVHVIPNGVEAHFLQDAQRSTRRPTVVWLGSWIARKGIDLLPKIVEVVARNHPTAVFHLVGCGVPARAVLDCFPVPLHPRLRITPVTDRQGVAAACAEAWVGLSTSYFEGFGKNIIEMLACGLPVVATPAGVAAEVVTDTVTGRLVGHDARQIGAALSELLDNPFRIRRMGAAARSAVRGYGWEAIGACWNKLLEAVLEACSQEPSRTKRELC